MYFRLLLLIGLWFCATVHAAPVILVVGDSLSAGYGLKQNEGWVSLLETRLIEQGFAHQVVNASISGETTAGALERFEPLLGRHAPDTVIIELGGNDGLRGLTIGAMRKNLSQMIDMAQKAHARVVLVGMALPPNYGPLYDSAFRKTYRDLAEQYGTALVPFLLAGIENDLAAFQSDGIHPNAASQIVLLNNVWPVLAAQLTGPSSVRPADSR